MSDDTEALGGLTAEEQNAFAAMQAGDEPAEQPQEGQNEAEAEEPDLDADDDGEQPDKPDRKVPLGALKAEREKRRAIEAERVRERQEAAVLKDRLNILLASLNQQKAPEPEPVPDPEENIFAYTKHLETQIKAQREEQQRIVAERQQAAQLQQLVAQTQAAEQAFAKEKPDYFEAVAHLKANRDAELAAMGYDPAYRAQILVQEAQALARQAWSAGRTPAEVAYDLAKARGWQPPPSKAQADSRLANLAKAQAANKSLSSASGSAGVKQITAEDIARMSDEDFGKWYEKHGTKGLRSLGM